MKASLCDFTPPRLLLLSWEIPSKQSSRIPSYSSSRRRCGCRDMWLVRWSVWCWHSLPRWTWHSAVFCIKSSDRDLAKQVPPCLPRHFRYVIGIQLLDVPKTIQFFLRYKVQKYISKNTDPRSYMLCSVGKKSSVSVKSCVTVIVTPDNNNM